MAHLYITKKLKFKASDIAQGVVVFRGQGHLRPLLPRKRYATLSDAVLEVARVMETQEKQDADLASIVDWAIHTTCEVSSRGHAYDDIVEALGALTGLPTAMVAKGLQLVGFNVVVVEETQYLCGAVKGRSGYLKARSQ